MLSYEKLCHAVAANDWTSLMDILKPKYFPRDAKGILIEKKILAKVAETLTAPNTDIPTNVRIVLLKCLVNSCVDGYTYEKLSLDYVNEELSQNYYNKLYNDDLSDDAQFPYDGTVHWAVNYILKYIENSKDTSDDRLEIVRLGVQFLCNLLTFSCKNNDLPAALNGDDFKSSIMTLVASKWVPLARAACAFVHNALKRSPKYYNETQIKEMAETLIEANKLGISSAAEILILLMKRPDWLRTIYDDLSMEHKLYALEIILEDVRESVYSESNNAEKSTNFPGEVVKFLGERFRRRSDLILKTVDSYLAGMEPTEITLLLDIIGVISSKDSFECKILQSDKSLVINCIFLLKSLHMAGRESDNYFTPVQKLSEIAPSNREIGCSSDDKGNVEKHPAFGFKAGLIRAIGNLAHRHKENQELLRETDAIPLLLDCCNIDARNPLIMQWSIFALRNVCENSPESQEIIRNCNRVGIVDNEIIREMGLKLHEAEDGKAIGIIPLPRNK